MNTTTTRGRGHRRRPHHPGPEQVRAILYARVSTTDQGQNGGSLDGQLDSLERLAAERGWIVVGRLTDTASGSTLDRPGITEALARLAAGEASVLAVAKLDRLSRSVGDFAATLSRSQAEGWTPYVADIGYDGSTAHGRLVANILSALGEWEREMIGTRTSEGIAALKSQGRYGKVKVNAATVQRIVSLHDRSAQTFAQIAHTLEAEGVPSPTGRPWTRGMAWGVYNRWALDHPQDETVTA